MNEVSYKVAEWLRSLDKPNDTSAVRPVIVTLFGVRYPGAEYIQLDRDNQPRLYIVGTVPPKLLKKKHRGKSGETYSGYCFTRIDSGMEWYLASYFRTADKVPSFVNPDYMQYHPFGDSILIFPWDIPGQKIDHYEALCDNQPYERIPLSVQYLS